MGDKSEPPSGGELGVLPQQFVCPVAEKETLVTPPDKLISIGSEPPPPSNAGSDVNPAAKMSDLPSTVVISLDTVGEKADFMATARDTFAEIFWGSDAVDFRPACADVKVDKLTVTIAENKTMAAMNHKRLNLFRERLSDLFLIISPSPFC